MVCEVRVALRAFVKFARRSIPSLKKQQKRSDMYRCPEVLPYLVLGYIFRQVLLTTAFVRSLITEA
jgi:hypothetical protein